MRKLLVRKNMNFSEGVKILLEKEYICGSICIGYNCNALQFWSVRKLVGPPQAGRISRHFYYIKSFGGTNERN